MPGREEKIAVSWSGGKDSSMALYELRKSGHYKIVTLLTTVAEEYGRVSHHGVRTELLEQQAAAVSLPLHKLYLPSTCTNEDYEARMKQTMLGYKKAGIRAIAFGDIFLQDLREYRERNLAQIGMRGVFPVWRRNTTEMIQTFIDSGFKAYITCVDGNKLDRVFAGRMIDTNLLHDLPDDVDPCGENGEYHSFVYDGPIFNRPVRVTVGETILRDSRFFADLLPEAACQFEEPSPCHFEGAKRLRNPCSERSEESFPHDSLLCEERFLASLEMTLGEGLE